MKKNCIVKIEINYNDMRIHISTIDGKIDYGGVFDRIEFSHGELVVYFSEGSNFIFVRAQRISNLPVFSQGWVIKEVV